MLYSRNSEAAPAGTRDGLTPQPDETRKGVAPMIEHPAPPARQFLDGCPNCLAHGHKPHEVIPDGIKEWPGVFAHYRCHDCGERWTTSWAVD